MLVLQLTTSVWSVIFGFGYLSMVSRVAQTCKTLHSSSLVTIVSQGHTKELGIGQGGKATLSLPIISLHKMNDDLAYIMTPLGLRHLYCCGSYWVGHGALFHMALLAQLRSLHIGHVPTNEVWLTLVQHGKRLEALLVDDADCPPLLPVGHATFDDLKHLNRLVLPQRPYRVSSSSLALLQMRRQAITIVTAALRDPDLLRSLLRSVYPMLRSLAGTGDAYSLWCLGHLIESGWLQHEHDAKSAIQWFYRRSAQRGFAMGQFALFRFLQEEQAAKVVTTCPPPKWSSSSLLKGDKDDDGGDIGVLEGKRDATYLLHWAAMQSNVFALTTLAERSKAQGEYQSMATFLHLAASQGDIDAMYEIGHSHFYGLGVPMDDDEAHKWFQKAAGFIKDKKLEPFEPGQPWMRPPRQLANLYYHLGLCKMLTMDPSRPYQDASLCFAQSIRR